GLGFGRTVQRQDLLGQLVPAGGALLEEEQAEPGHGATPLPVSRGSLTTGALQSCVSAAQRRPVEGAGASADPGAPPARPDRATAGPGRPSAGALRLRPAPPARRRARRGSGSIRSAA